MKLPTLKSLTLALYNAERLDRGDYPLAELPHDERTSYSEAAEKLLPVLARHLKRKALFEQQARMEAAELDAEALELLKAATGEDFSTFPAHPSIADFWRNAARRARQLHNR